MGKQVPKWLPRVKREVWRRFPEMNSVEPKLSSRNLVAKSNGDASGGANTRRSSIHTLTFRKSVRLDDGAKSTQIIRVVADSSGRIKKVVCNR